MTGRKMRSAKCLLLTAALLAVTTTGCASTGRAAAHRAAARQVAASESSLPLPISTVRRLPSGEFYFLWGPVGAEDNLWEVSAGGRQRQLTHNPRGFEIDAFAASQAGIILSDALYNVDQLARWTSHGAAWMQPWHAQGKYVGGFSPDIRPDGQIAYSTPANTIWVRKSFTGPARILYRYPRRFHGGDPVFGPRGQVALVPGADLAIGQKPTVLIISRTGAVRQLRTGIRQLGYPPVWGQHAPALAIPPILGAEKLFFPDSRQQQLPAGWRALTWSPDDTRLLVLSRTSLGVWSMSQPGHVSIIGPVNRASEVVQASWLRAPAPLRILH